MKRVMTGTHLVSVHYSQGLRLVHFYVSGVRLNPKKKRQQKWMRKVYELASIWLKQSSAGR